MGISWIIDNLVGEEPRIFPRGIKFELKRILVYIWELLLRWAKWSMYSLSYPQFQSKIKEGPLKSDREVSFCSFQIWSMYRMNPGVYSTKKTVYQGWWNAGTLKAMCVRSFSLLRDFTVETWWSRLCVKPQNRPAWTKLMLLVYPLMKSTLLNSCFNELVISVFLKTYRYLEDIIVLFFDCWPNIDRRDPHLPPWQPARYL